MRKGEVNVITLGCAKNLVDSERLLKMFLSAGYRVRHDPERITGEIVVVNTCAFIASAQEESINTILGLIQAKNQGKIARLYVMGCLGERFRSDLKAELPEIDAVYGKFDWKKLLDDLGLAHNVMLGERVITTPRHYAYVKVSEGCDRHCSYCAIPLITGPMKSREIADVVKEVEHLTIQGVTEFLLIAQDLTAYGRDFGGKTLLGDLLLRLSDLPRVRRLRLHYAYPTSFPLEILPIIRERGNICKYLDLALQHSSNRMLQLMRRGITSEETSDLLLRIRQEVPHIVLRTTFMVGHPGETEEDFENLLQFVEMTRFERMGAFIYSHEQGTYSYKHYRDDVPEGVKHARYEKLMTLQQSFGEAFSRSLIGSLQEVVVDRCEDDYYVGRTPYDSPEVDPEVLIPMRGLEKKLRIGSYYKMEIIGNEGFDLVARPVS